VARKDESDLLPGNMATTQSDQIAVPVVRDWPFRLLLAGSSASMLGTRISTIAFPMLVLWVTNSPIAAGWTAFAATAPSILVYMPAGALVDLWPPRRVMLISEFGRGVAIATVVVILWLGTPSIFMLISAVVVEEILEVFSTLAERRYVGLLVGRKKAAPAMVRLEARTHLVVLAGRPLGGLLFMIMPLLPFIADMLSFIISVSMLFSIKRQQTARSLTIFTAKAVSFLSCRPAASSSQESWTSQHPISRRKLWNDIREGLLWLYRDKFARATVALSAATTLICQALIMIFLAYAHRQHLSSLTMGMALAGSGLGGALGSMIASRLPAPAVFSWTLIRRGAWLLAILVLATSGELSFSRMALVMGVLGFTGALGNVELGSYLIERAPEEMLARTTSVSRLMSFAACALGPIIGGFTIQRYGVRSAVLLLCVAITIMSLFSLLVPSTQPLASNPRNIRAILLSVAAPFRTAVRRRCEDLAHWLAQKGRPEEVLVRATGAGFQMSHGAWVLSPIIGWVASRHYGFRGAAVPLSIAVSVMVPLLLLMPLGRIRLRKTGTKLRRDATFLYRKAITGCRALWEQSAKVPRKPCTDIWPQFLPEALPEVLPMRGDIPAGTAAPGMAFVAQLTPTSETLASSSQSGTGNPVFSK
jgi:MFS family permease